MTSISITGARVVVIDEATERGGDVHIDGGVVTDSKSTVSDVVDATGCVVTPGLVNAHHHLLQTAFRTLPGAHGVTMERWLPTMAAAYAASGIDAELCAMAASAGLAEALLSGVTTIADHHLTWPPGCDSVAIAQGTTSAARELGARLVFVRGSAGDDPEEAAASVEGIAAQLVPFGGITDDGLLQLAVGPAGVHSDGPDTFRLLGQVAAKLGLRRRTQANEQVDVKVAREKYDTRPLDVLEEWGWLAPDVTLAHLCDVTASEIERLGASGITATHASGCDLPMGWGIAPVQALRAAGVTVGLGTSGGGSNDAGHLLADARLALQVAPLAPLNPGTHLSARNVLGMATAGSAHGLGRPELGHLRAGAAGDACVWDVSSVLDAGVADPVAGLLWAAPGRRPRHVVVGGRVVVRDYQLVTADARSIATRLSRRVGR